MKEIKQKIKEFNGYNNIFVGENAGKNAINPQECILIGKNAGLDIINDKRMLVIKIGKQELRKKMTTKEYHFMKYYFMRGTY